MNKQRKLIKEICQYAILIAIELIIAFTPLGSIPIGPIVATLGHIPVLIAACILGVKGGAIMGFGFGSLSMIVMTINPQPTSFVFTPFYGIGNGWSLVICFVPRILFGVICGLLVKGIETKLKKKTVKVFSYAGVAVFSTFIHSILVLGMIYLFFGREYSEVCGIEYSALLGAIGMVIITNTLLEAALAAVIVPAVSLPIKKYLN